jgi:hypothetical protein
MKNLQFWSVSYLCGVVGVSVYHVVYGLPVAEKVHAVVDGIVCDAGGVGAPCIARHCLLSVEVHVVATRTTLKCRAIESNHLSINDFVFHHRLGESDY